MILVSNKKKNLPFPYYDAQDLLLVLEAHLDFHEHDEQYHELNQ